MLKPRRPVVRQGIAAAQDQFPHPLRQRNSRLGQPEIQTGWNKQAVFPAALSQEHFQKNDPEAPDVGGGTDLFFLVLFRSCVGSRSESGKGICPRTTQNGETEIRDLSGPVPGKKNIGRLQIPVYESPAVGIGHAACDLNADIQYPFLGCQDI